jgi:excisionase family DNA binding protein
VGHGFLPSDGRWRCLRQVTGLPLSGTVALTRANVPYLAYLRYSPRMATHIAAGVPLVALLRSNMLGDMSADDHTLTAKQAAALLHVHYRLVTRLAESGEIPGRKVGRAWRFSEAALREWLRGRGESQPTD